MSHPRLHNGSQSFEVIVIGGGVIGLSVAWRAAQRGMHVALLDRGQPGEGTSWVAAGMLAPISEAVPTEQRLLHLGLASARAYPDFTAELAELTGLDPGYLRCGTIATARDADEAAALEREHVMRTELGLPVRRLRPSEARRLEPSLAPGLRLALEAADDHAVDPRKLTTALARAGAQAGVELHAATEVAEVAIADEAPGASRGRVGGVVLADGRVLRAEQVVVAAGVGSGAVGGIPAEAQVPIHPVKGQILRLHDPAGPGLVERVLRMGGGYVVPRGDGRYVIGATMEERGLDTTVTAGGAFELLRDAIEVLPGVAELVIDELAAGLRPTTPDNAPAIGPAGIRGLHWATGHFRNGILLAPVTADILCDALTGSEPHELAREFAPARFADFAPGPTLQARVPVRG